MSWENKRQLDRDTKEGTSPGDRNVRKKKERLLRKKISSLTLLCGPLKKHKLRTPDLEEKRKPQRRIGNKDCKAPKEELCCRRQDRHFTMCPKCEIVICRKCDTLHADSLFVAHSLLDHYDI
ncbi:uncharacterized protein C17orf50 homolog [Discoglossus pictus]